MGARWALWARDHRNGWRILSDTGEYDRQRFKTSNVSFGHRFYHTSSTISKKWKLVRIPRGPSEKHSKVVGLTGKVEPEQKLRRGYIGERNKIERNMCMVVVLVLAMIIIAIFCKW